MIEAKIYENGAQLGEISGDLVMAVSATKNDKGDLEGGAVITGDYKGLDAVDAYATLGNHLREMLGMSAKMFMFLLTIALEGGEDD